MKSFMEYIQEGSLLAPLALAGSIMAGGAQVPPAQPPVAQTTQTAPAMDTHRPITLHHDK